jgi:hypothetical protein
VVMTNRNGWLAASGVAGALTVFAIIAFIFVGGYGLYWWLARDTTEKRYEVNTGTQQYQASLISENQDRLQDYVRAQDPGQKEALRQMFCADVQKIKDIDVHAPDLASAKIEMCPSAAPAQRIPLH